MPVKYVFVTGGVVSGLGKGITAASLGRLLKARGYSVTMQKFDPYICFTNSFDGSGAIRACMTNVRVVCSNTLNLALNNSTRQWSTRHIGDLNAKLETARETLALANKYNDGLEIFAEKAAEIKISNDELIDSLFPINENDSNRRINNVMTDRNNFEKCLIAVDLRPFYGTLWGALNAASDWHYHIAPNRLTDSYQEGKALNEKYYSDDHSDWTYYNSDYYYQCNDTNAALRESARKMTEKWELDGINCDEIEANSSLTLDGGFDFNSIWNSDFRNQVGRSSLAKESTIPPENFKMFFKEQVTSFAEDNKFNGNLKITIGKNNYDINVPFQTLRTGSEGEIRNVWDLMKDYYSNTEDNSKVKNFLSNMSVFTRWYSYETGINDKFGDY